MRTLRTMSDALTVTEPGPPATIRADVRMPNGKRIQISAKLKRALDAIVWQGATYHEAATIAGTTTEAVRSALGRPHVIRYLREQRQVFREAARAQNIHVAVEIRDQKENQTARVQAMKFIEELGSAGGSSEGQRAVAPGVVVQVTVNQASRAVDETVIEVGHAAAPDTQSGGNEG